MKILLVDDEPHVTRAIQQLVNWDELSIDTVLTASSGHDALEQMELYVPEILMTDVVMPDMTGLDLIKTVHANYPHTKILMITDDGAGIHHIADLFNGDAHQTLDRMLCHGKLLLL